MEIKEVFAKRLKNARIIRNLSMKELSNKMDCKVSSMTISKYENMLLFPSSPTLIAIAKALDLPVDYFFRSFSMNVESVKFRKKSTLPKREENLIKKSIADSIERYMNIEEICEAKVKYESIFKKVVKNENDIKKCAEELRKKWEIGFDSISNVIEMLEEHGIKVLDIEAPLKFDGLSTFVNEMYPVIVLNKNMPSERKRFTALHELGHISFNFSEKINEEYEENLCNLFASEMLIPEQTFKMILGEKRHDISYQELKAMQIQYGISCDALMFKAKYEKVISEQRFKFYCIKKNKYPELRKSIEKSLYQDEVSSRFNRLVYKALSNDLITISKAANLLHQSVEQVNKDLNLV